MCRKYDFFRLRGCEKKMEKRDIEGNWAGGLAWR